MKIEELIKKFYDAESSKKEEYSIKYYLNIEKHHQNNIIQKQFELYNDYSKNENVSPEFDNKLIDKINKYQNRTIIKLLKPKRIFYAAASIVIIVCSITAYYFINEIPEQQKKGIVITDKNIKQHQNLAEKEIQKAFQLLTDNYDSALESLDKLNIINKYIDKKEQNNKSSKKQEKEK